MSPNEKIIAIGIDVSKKTLAVASLQENRETVNISIGNDAQSIESFMNSIAVSMRNPDIPIVLESTGDFHLLPALLLHERGFAVKCINPLISKQLEKRSVRGQKTDKIDAQRLAKLGADEPALAAFTASRQQILARKQVGTLAKLKTVIQELTGHITRSEETAKTLGISMDLTHAKQAIAELKEQIHVIEAALAEVMQPVCKTIAQETKGVSEKQMAILSAFLSGKTFTDRDQLVAFAGLDVRVRESGMWSGRARLSKRGNSFLRRTLFHIGWGLAVHHPEYRAYFLQKKAKGAHHYTAILACARKFLRGTVHTRLYGIHRGQC